MKFEISRILFLSKLKIVAKFAKKDSSNNKLPILAHVLIEAKENKIVLKCTNLDIGIVLEIHDIFIREFGSVCVPVEKLIEAMSVSDNESVSFSLNKKTCILQIDNIKLKCLDGEEFPPVSIKPDEKSFAFRTNAKKFFAAIESVDWACSKESKNVNDIWMEGVIVLLNEHAVFCTDRNKFSICYIETNNTLPVKFVIPKYVDWKSVYTSENDDCFCNVTDSTLQVKIGNINIFVTTFSSSEIFDFDKDFLVGEYNFVISKKSLRKIISASNTIDFASKLVFSSGVMSVTSKSEIGNHQNDVEIALEMEGNIINVNINNSFLLSAIANCPSEVISLGIHSKNRLILKAIGKDWFTVIAGMVL